MKSFSQFWEEATLSDLERQHAQSAEGRKEARMSAVKIARQKAKNKRRAEKQFTKRKRAEMLSKRAELSARVSQQRHKAEELKARQRAQREQSRRRARQTSHNVSQAAKGTYQLTKVAISGVRKAVQKRRDKKQTGTQEG